MSKIDWKNVEVGKVASASALTLGVLMLVVAIIFGIVAVWYGDPRAGGVAGILAFAGFISTMSGGMFLAEY